MVLRNFDSEIQGPGALTEVTITNNKTRVKGNEGNRLARFARKTTGDVPLVVNLDPRTETEARPYVQLCSNLLFPCRINSEESWSVYRRENSRRGGPTNWK